MKLLKNSRGTSLVEYVLILVLVAVAAISAVKVLRSAINQQYRSVAQEVRDVE